MKKFVGGVNITKSNLTNFITQLTAHVSITKIMRTPDTLVSNINNLAKYQHSKLQLFTNEQKNSKNSILPYTIAESKQHEIFLILVTSNIVSGYTLVQEQKSNKLQLVQIADACLSVLPHNDIFSLQVKTLKTNPDYQNSGIGTSMLEFIESYASYLQCEELSLICERKIIKTETPLNIESPNTNSTLNLQIENDFYTDKNEIFYFKNGFKHYKLNQATYDPQLDSSCSISYLNNNLVEMYKANLIKKNTDSPTINNLISSKLNQTLLVKPVHYHSSTNMLLFNINNLNENIDKISIKTMVSDCNLNPISKLK